jgi:hypothetical protein
MTQRFETKMETRPVTHCVERVCDLCGGKAASPEWSQWETSSSYDVSEVHISCEEGSSFPEGRSTEKLFFDVCPTCFHEKVVPWMESQGAKPSKRAD